MKSTGISWCYQTNSFAPITKLIVWIQKTSELVSEINMFLKIFDLFSIIFTIQLYTQSINCLFLSFLFFFRRPVDTPQSYSKGPQPTQVGARSAASPLSPPRQGATTNYPPFSGMPAREAPINRYIQQSPYGAIQVTLTAALTETKTSIYRRTDGMLIFQLNCCSIRSPFGRIHMHEYHKCRSKLNIIELDQSQFQQVFQYHMVPHHHQPVRLKRSQTMLLIDLVFHLCQMVCIQRSNYLH